MNLAFLKKYLVLEIWGVVVLTALIVVGVKLTAVIRQYTGEKNALQAVMARKQQLDRRDPYPSVENVKQEAENFKDILDNYNELNELLRARQIEPQRMRPAAFMSLLENTLRRLRAQLRQAQVAYPPKFTFGFQRYAGGKLPAAGDIPLLVQQLKIIEMLCQALGQIGVDELVAFSRDEFELTGRSGAPAAPQPRGAPSPAEQAEDDSLYTTQHFKMEIKANEGGVFDLLNLMIRLPMFTVVTSVEMNNLKPFLHAGSRASVPAPAAAGTATTNEPASREQRVVSGKEPVDLKLELDVYQFAPSLNFKEIGKK